MTRLHPSWQLQGGPVAICDPSKPLMRLCQCCKRQLDGTSNRPIGEAVPIGVNQSHGLCVECVRDWAEDLGLSPADVDRLEAAAKEAA
jgi:hypothetical protein